MVVLLFCRGKFILTITVILHLLAITQACVIKFSIKKETYSKWDKEEWSRNKAECECGTHVLSNSVKKPPPWNVYVHTRMDSESDQMKTCMGTIINSNTIVTSHKCLRMKNQPMRLVDIFKYKMGRHSIARMKDITVTTTRELASASPSQKFAVDDVWYNPKFALTSELQRTNKTVKLEDDLVLIKVSANFIDNKAFQLICIQPYNDKLEDIRERGYFYAYTTEDEEEEEEDENTKSLTASPEDIEVIEGDVRKLIICRRPEDPSKDPALNKTFCLKHPAEEKNMTEGGPLIVTSGKRSFLLGVATQIPDSSTFTGREASVGMEQTFFTAIGPMVRFIEYFSKQSASKWCDSPEFKVKTGSGPDSATAIQAKGRAPWPWENLEEPIERDEELNCVCGEPSFKIMGRVVGGEEATPREFGWMAVLQLYPNGKSGGGALCGGSVITDRIILTAAHCVVVDKWLYEGKRKVSIDPKNIEVTLNAHKRRGDPEGIPVKLSAVLFHPEYLKSRMEEYYDADIALLVLKERLKFVEEGPGIRPICLHKYGEYEDPVDQSAWVVGWGLTDPKDKGSAADVLQKLQVPIAKLSYCSRVASSRVTDNFLCAGTLDMYKDAASGDSGGPLQIQNTETKQWYQVGAVSWGEDVKRGKDTLTAALYADVQKLLPFIDYHARRLDAKWCKPKKVEEKGTDTEKTETE